MEANDVKRSKNILHVTEPSAAQESAVARRVALAQNDQAQLTLDEGCY